MANDSPTSLAPGFRFHPTDDELVRFYLKRKIIGKPFRVDPIAVVDVYKNEPWDLPYKSKLKTRDLEWYFYSALDKKYGNGSRTKRATEKGYWKTTGKDRAVKHGSRTVGMKKTLVYHSGRAPHGDRTNWVMHEYKLVDEQLAQAGILQDALVLCRIFEKSGAGPKNGEKYGAPLIEEEWEDDEVAPVPSIGDQASNEALALDPTGFVEMNDLDKKLDVVEAIGNADLPTNFYYGECSSYPEQSRELIKDEKPLEGNVGISEPQNGQFFNFSEQYAVDTNSVKDGDSVELRNNENALSFNYTFDDLDVYLDAIDYPLINDDGLFLEAKDLLNPYEGNPIEADPSGTAMLDEYLSYSDDDISKYISFDAPLTMENENPIPDQGSPFIQQNVEGETNDIPMDSKHDIEATSSNEASSKQNQQLLSGNTHPIVKGETNDITVDSKHDYKATSSNEASSKQNQQLLSGNTHPFVKQANKFLASIPAPPAFASEFPPKDALRRLHSAAQSSNSAHVTAGMISITEITVRGNVMDWLVSKNGGGLNAAIMSTELSQPDVNSSALMRASGSPSSKMTTFVLSHGCVLVSCFSVVILSLSFKIGSFMYTGK